MFKNNWQTYGFIFSTICNKEWHTKFLVLEIFAQLGNLRYNHGGK